MTKKSLTEQTETLQIFLKTTKEDRKYSMKSIEI